MILEITKFSELTLNISFFLPIFEKLWIIFLFF